MFNKFKDFYKKNRVYSILMIVSCVCIISIFIGIIIYFIGQSTRNKYGDRLEGIESVKIQDSKQTEIEGKFTNSNNKIKSAKIDLKGKLIYIILNLNEGTHDDAILIAQTGLDYFSKEEKDFYDIQYIIDNASATNDNKFPIMGYLSSGESTIKWTNYSS